MKRQLKPRRKKIKELDKPFDGQITVHEVLERSKEVDQ